MKKIFFALIASILFLTITFTPTANETAQAQTMWGKIELKKGMIGKVKIVKDTYQYSISKKKLKTGSKLKKGKEYGVYSYSKSYSGIYKIGSNKYVKKSSLIKYYTVPQNLLNDLKGYGNIKGAITWQYNNYVGTKPDVGASIFLIPSNFNSKKFQKEELESYAIGGHIPKDSNLFYAKANGYGEYEINDVPAGEYIIVISSGKTYRDFDEEITVKNILEPRLGESYPTFEQFRLHLYKHKVETIEINKDKTIDYSHDFGYTYL